MEAAIGAASGLIGIMVNHLSNELVEAYVASSQLGLNSEKIKEDLLLTQGLLHEAQRRGISSNPGLQGLLQKLTAKADEAEDALDELHYFIIQDQLDGTRHAVPDLGVDLQAHARHGRRAVRHTVGNCLSCFSCLHMQDDDGVAAVTNNPNNATNPGVAAPVDRLSFDRVAMSMKIKLVIEEMHSLCDHVFKLLHIVPHHGNTATITLTRPPMGSITAQNKLYGRSAIFEKTINDISSGTYHTETLHVLPIVGPGGIGKTTFTQHLYNDKRIEDHFNVKVWICVSTNFDVLKLTQQIHNCILATEKEESNSTTGTTNLDQLQITIAHRLKSKRFLIVLDDMWKCDSDAEWSNLLVPFTKGEAKGSMVLVTTRFPKIEEMVKKSTIPINLQGLEPKKFLEFFQACVFGENIPDQQYSELIDTGRKIAEKLKCSPLAAKTVARLLKKNLSWEHWRKVLENNEWKNQTSSDDIMLALKISYDYLPFHLKQCFSYFSLFPEDHRFTNLETTRFWTAIGIIDCSCKNGDCLEELVDNGFLVKETNNLEHNWYVMHDLLHDLSLSVSSQQCCNISSGLSFCADSIPQSVKHISITMDDRYDENFRKEMAKLKSGINIGKLQTLMIFRGYEKWITDILKETFNEIEGLRVLLLVMNCPDSLPKNFSKLLHLRYLRIRSPYGLKLSLPSTLPRFFHLLFLDLKDWHGSSSLPEHISRLVNLRHFIAHNELHSNVPKVGKIKHLEELTEFHVKKVSVGFELEELGELTDLGGELIVYNLEKVATKEEANKANLSLKKNLKRLVLVWVTKELVMETDIADGLQPHVNLRELVIMDHGAAIGPPSWLCRDIPMKHLEFLTLDGVCWGTLPPFGQLVYLKRLELKNIAGVRIVGPDLSVMHLKEVEFDEMPDLEKWVVGPNCDLFPMLQSINCRGCPNFIALPFLSECFVPCTQAIHPRYPSLCEFSVSECPKLSLPPMPHLSTLTRVEVFDCQGHMIYRNNRLSISCYGGVLAFHNMGKLEIITFADGSKIPWTDLQKLTSIKELKIQGDPSMQSMAPLSNYMSLISLQLVDCENITLDEFNPLIMVNLKKLVVYNSGNCSRSIAADLLSEVASRTKVFAAGSFQLKTLEVDSISAVLVVPICSLLAPTLRCLSIRYDDRVESFTELEAKALQLLTSLEELLFQMCLGLPSLPRGLHNISSLRVLYIYGCPEIRSLPKEGLPTSLQLLHAEDCSAELQEEMKTLQGTNPDLRVKS